MQDASKQGQRGKRDGPSLKYLWANMKREPVLATFMVIGVVNSFLFSLAILYLTFVVWW